jgi:hypothetical protein
MYIHHKILDPEAMAAGPPAGLDERLESLGHDFAETWYFAGDMSHALLIAEFASSQDMVTHFNELDASGLLEQANGNVFEITSADVIGDVDDDARAALSRYDFVNFLAPMPQG